VALTGQQPAALTCHDITVGAPATDLVTLANAELGTAQLSGPHPAAQGWAISGWLVAHAVAVGVDKVTFDGRTWTAASGSWSAPGVADGILSLHQVTNQA
jgi:predicted benzoate:H+ symporter BenE